MADDLLVLHVSELLTLRGPERARRRVEMSDLSMIRDGAVAVSDGIVKDVGKSESILKEHDATGVERIDAKGRVVMPGFIDPHTHLVYAGSRDFELELKAKGKSYMEIMAAGGGIVSTVRATRIASLQQLLDEPPAAPRPGSSPRRTARNRPSSTAAPGVATEQPKRRCP